MNEWKVYLKEGEKKAFQMIEDKDRSDIEDIKFKRREILSQFHKFVHSKEYCTLREKEKIYFSVKNYIEADKCSRAAARLEESEKLFH
jgi:hypothetical protein